MKPLQPILALAFVLAAGASSVADETPPGTPPVAPAPVPLPQEEPKAKSDPAPPEEGKPAPKPAADPPAAKPAADPAAEAAADAKAREVLKAAAARQNAGELAAPGKLRSFHVVFHKATFEKAAASPADKSLLVETDDDGLVFDWMQESIKTAVTIDGRTTTKAWYDPAKIGWIFDGTTVAPLLGTKYKADYDQLQFHRRVVGQLLDVAILEKLLGDGSRWRVVDAAPRAQTVAIERIPPADAPGAVAIRLWVANPSEGVFGDVVAASMPPTAETGATTTYDFEYHEKFPNVRVPGADGELSPAKLRFPFRITVHQKRDGDADETKVLEVFTASVDVNSVEETAFAQPKPK